MYGTDVCAPELLFGAGGAKGAFPTQIMRKERNKMTVKERTGFKRSEKVLAIVFLTALLMIGPAFPAAASNSSGKSAASEFAFTPKKTDTSSASVTYKGLTTSIKGLSDNNYRQVLEAFARNIPESLKTGRPYSYRDQTFIDAEKYSVKFAKEFDDRYDALLCWASAGANMLTASGYAKRAVNPLTKRKFKNEDEVFDYFRKCFADYSGEPDGGITYFLKGTYPYEGDTTAAQLRENAPKGGLLKDAYAGANLKSYKYDDAPDILDRIHALTDVSAALVVDSWSLKSEDSEGTHALTVAGIVTDNKEKDVRRRYKGIILADSDNNPVINRSTSTESAKKRAKRAALAPNVYVFYPLSFRTIGSISWWTIKNYMDDADLVTGIKLVYTMKDSPSSKKAASPKGSGKGRKKRNDPDDQSGRKTKASADIPAKPASVKVKAGKNKVTVSWKKIGRSEGDRKLRAQIKGVQIQYSTDPKFKKSRVTKKVGRDRTKAVLKLKKKKTYYIRLRYFGSGGTSKWTEAKKVSIGN